MPDFDFDAFNHDQTNEEGEQEVPVSAEAAPSTTYESVAEAKEEISSPVTAPDASLSEDVDKW